MYVLKVKPWQSKGWMPPEGERLGEVDRERLGLVKTAGGGDEKVEGLGEGQGVVGREVV